MRFTDFPEYKRLKRRHRIFVLAYIRNGCRDQGGAARAAGYKGVRAKQAGWLLTKREDVRAAIHRIGEAVLSSLEKDIEQRVADRALADRTALLTEDGKKVRPLNEWPPDLRACVQGVKFDKETGVLTEVLTAPLNEAGKLFLQMRKILTERHEVTGANGGPIELRAADDLTDEELAAIARRGRPAPAEPEDGED